MPSVCLLPRAMLTTPQIQAAEMMPGETPEEGEEGGDIHERIAEGMWLMAGALVW